MKPTIYIGLGRTGIRAIAQTKKLYEDAYGVGNIPKCIAFLAIDCDLAYVKSPYLPTSLEEDAIMIPYDGSPKVHYETHVKQGAYSWMFPGNTNSLGHRISDGTGLVRTTGRFYTEDILDSIDATIHQRWLQVTSVADVSKFCYDDIVDFHIVMSFAGGTGAGSFINVAELISRKYGRRAHIFGYGVLHGVFRTQDPFGTHTPKVRVNAYSAMVDLDYLMHASVANPIKIEINGDERELTSPIFNEFFVIDNQTANGNLVPYVKELCAAVGTCLFASGDDMGSKVRSVLNNCDWKSGVFNISSKVGWVRSFGVCNVVYKGEELAKIYGYKAAIELIRKMCQESSDARQLAQQWTEEVGVREDGEQYNMLIDRIVEPRVIEGLKNPMVDAKTTEAENKSLITSYINNVADIPAEARINEMKEEKKQLLVDKVKSLLSLESGVGNSRIFLESLIRLCDKYRMEMDNEVEQLNHTLEGKNVNLAKATKAYEEYCGRIRLLQSLITRQTILDDMARFAKDIRKINYEIKRCEIARDIFIYLVKEAEELSRKIATLDELLKTLSADYSQSLINLQTPSASSRIFEYDLSVNDRLNMALKDDISLASLLWSLPASLLDLDVENQLRPAIEQYVASLPQAVAYRERNISDIIEELSNEDYKELKFQINIKSSRLLRIDDRGIVEPCKGATPSEMMVQSLFLSVYNPENAREGNEENRPQTRLELDYEFATSDNLKKEFLETDLAMLRQQMIVVRVDGAVIPYCIESFDEDVVGEYERQVASANMGNATFNPHFDKNMYEMMRKSNFKLKP